MTYSENKQKNNVPSLITWETPISGGTLWPCRPGCPARNIEFPKERQTFRPELLTIFRKIRKKTKHKTRTTHVTLSETYHKKTQCLRPCDLAGQARPGIVISLRKVMFFGQTWWSSLGKLKMSQQNQLKKTVPFKQKKTKPIIWDPLTLPASQARNIAFPEDNQAVQPEMLRTKHISNKFKNSSIWEALSLPTRLMGQKHWLSKGKPSFSDRNIDFL